MRTLDQALQIIKRIKSGKSVSKKVSKKKKKKISHHGHLAYNLAMKLLLNNLPPSQPNYSKVLGVPITNELAFDLEPHIREILKHKRLAASYADNLFHNDIARRIITPRNDPFQHFVETRVRPILSRTPRRGGVGLSPISVPSISPISIRSSPMSIESFTTALGSPTISIGNSPRNIVPNSPFYGNYRERANSFSSSNYSSSPIFTPGGVRLRPTTPTAPSGPFGILDSVGQIVADSAHSIGDSLVQQVSQAVPGPFSNIVSALGNTVNGVVSSNLEAAAQTAAQHGLDRLEEQANAYFNRILDDFLATDRPEYGPENRPEDWPEEIITEGISEELPPPVPVPEIVGYNFPAAIEGRPQIEEAPEPLQIEPRRSQALIRRPLNNITRTRNRRNEMNSLQRQIARRDRHYLDRNQHRMRRTDQDRYLMEGNRRHMTRRRREIPSIAPAA